MLFQPIKKLYPILLALFVALLVGPLLVRADDQPPLSFSLNFVQDLSNNYILTVGCRNNSLDNINQVYAYLPLDPRLEYQYYISSSKDSLVRRAVPERLEVAFNQVKPGVCVPVQIYFKRVANSRGSWTVFATGHYDGEPSINGVASNAVTIDLSGLTPPTPPQALQGGGPVSAGQSLSFSGTGYFASEVVSLWLSLSDGRSLALAGSSTITADNTGQIQFSLTLPANIPAGATSVVAYGQTSKLTRVGYMTVK